MLGWLWLIANGIQLHQQLTKRNARIVALEQELVGTKDEERRAEIERRMKEIREEAIVCDAGAKAVMNECEKSSARS